MALEWSNYEVKLPKDNLKIDWTDIALILFLFNYEKTLGKVVPSPAMRMVDTFFLIDHG